MKQSTFLKKQARLHVAIIMDGNGRWAELRGRPRPFGHCRGERAVRRIVESAADLGISTLTLFAFSSDNWKRPAPEVTNLLQLFEHFLSAEVTTCCKNGIRLSVIGRRDRLSPSLLWAIRKAERATRSGRRLDLRIAFDYSSRDAICRAARACAGEPLPGRAAFARILNQIVHSRPSTPAVDLLIRTGGEQRLSDFLLWECAYAELVFTDVLWPDFSSQDLMDSLRIFASRCRRYGQLPGRSGSRRNPPPKTGTEGTSVPSRRRDRVLPVRAAGERGECGQSSPEALVLPPPTSPHLPVSASPALPEETV